MTARHKHETGIGEDSRLCLLIGLFGSIKPFRAFVKHMILKLETWNYRIFVIFGCCVLMGSPFILDFLLHSRNYILGDEE